MNSHSSLFILIFSILLSSSLGAHPVQRFSGEPPRAFSVENNASGISEAEVWTWLALLHNEYGPEINQASPGSSPFWMMGFDWKKPYLGAGSLFVDQKFQVMLYGGLVRAQYMTRGALATILCHEVGHLIGGKPHQVFPGQGEHWSSAEGQADTFAAQECLPRLFEKYQKFFPQLFSDAPETIATELCTKSQEPQKCTWVATSGIDFVQTLQVYFDLEEEVAKPEKQASEIVTSTLTLKYPSYQCRMDIFKAKAQDPTGHRLPCWYATSQENRASP